MNCQPNVCMFVVKRSSDATRIAVDRQNRVDRVRPDIAALHHWKYDTLEYKVPFWSLVDINFKSLLFRGQGRSQRRPLSQTLSTRFTTFYHEHTNIWLTVHFLLRDLLHGTLYRSNFVAHPLTALPHVLIDCQWGSLDGVHIGATWRIRLNRPCAAAIWPYVKLLRPLISNHYLFGREKSPGRPPMQPSS